MLASTGVTVHSLHPGVIGTELLRDWSDSKTLQLFAPLILWLIKTPFYGAQTTLYCCLEEKLSNQSGLYYSDCDVKSVSNKQALSIEDQDKLWDLSSELTKYIPEIPLFFGTE